MEYKIPQRAHRYPDSLIGPDAPDDILAWACKVCGTWISEYSRDQINSECPGPQMEGVEIDVEF